MGERKRVVDGTRERSPTSPLGRLGWRGSPLPRRPRLLRPSPCCGLPWLARLSCASRQRARASATERIYSEVACAIYLQLLDLRRFGYCGHVRVRCWADDRHLRGGYGRRRHEVEHDSLLSVGPLNLLDVRLDFGQESQASLKRLAGLLSLLSARVGIEGDLRGPSDPLSELRRFGTDAVGVRVAREAAE